MILTISILIVAVLRNVVRAKRRNAQTGKFLSLLFLGSN